MPKLGSTLTQSKAQAGVQGSSSRSEAACASVVATVEHRRRRLPVEQTAARAASSPALLLAREKKAGWKNEVDGGGAERLADLKAGVGSLGPWGATRPVTLAHGDHGATGACARSGRSCLRVLTVTNAHY
jgi:hypothetical protein